MSVPNVILLHAMSQVIVDEIVSYTPDRFETVSIDPSASEDEQEQVVTEADFIIAFGLDPSDRVIRAAGKTKLVQLHAAGYDRMNTDLLREMEIPCTNIERV